MHRPRLPWPLASLAAAVCALVPLLGAAPADAQQSTIPDVCPGGQMRGPEGECVPGTGMGGSTAQPGQPGMISQGMMRNGPMMGPGMMGQGPGMMGNER